MIRTFTRVLILSLCAAVVGETLVLWSATGASAFTYYYSQARADQAAQTNDTASLFEGAGLDAGPNAQSIEPPPNRFMLGLFPSLTPDRLWRFWDRDLVSVFTLAGPAAIVGALTLLGITRDAMRRRQGARARRA